MTDTLKPCPFCGRSDLLGAEPYPEGGFLSVRCRACGGIGPALHSETEREAITAWNRRAHQHMTREELAEMITAVYDRELQIDDVLMTLECEVHARQAAQRQVTDLQERIARADVELQRAALAEREQAATAPLLARIAELEAELEKTKAIFAASCNHFAVMEMQRDAERHRLVRRGQHWSVINGIGDNLRADALDTAIDAAMKGE